MCIRDRHAGSVSTRYPQPPTAPGYCFNRSISMPEQPSNGQARLPESSGTSIMNSPRRVVGAYGLGAYTDNQRHTMPRVPLYPSQAAAPRPSHDDSSTLDRNALSGLAPQKDSRKFVSRRTPGYALYEG